MSGIETCNELEETVKKLTDIIHELNSTLKVANDLGLYILIDKVEKDVGNKINQLEFSLRKISKTIDFV